jgi:prefoldin alpha subunit
MTEMQIANETLSGLKSEQDGTQVLIPIGGGSYVKARLEDTDRVVVGIGADVSTEKDVASAQEDVGARLLELEKARGAAQKQLEDVVAQINRTQNQVRVLTGQQSEGKK